MKAVLERICGLLHDQLCQSIEWTILDCQVYIHIPQARGTCRKMRAISYEFNFDRGNVLLLYFMHYLRVSHRIFGI